MPILGLILPFLGTGKGKLLLYGGLVLALILGYLWHRNQIYQEGYRAGQTECQQKVEAAKQAEADRQREVADRLAQENRDNTRRLQDELTALRNIPDPTNCYTTAQPPALLERLRHEYERYRRP